MQQIKLNPIKDAPLDNSIILLFLEDGSVCDGWFCYGPIGNNVWVCCDDRFEVSTSEIKGWLPLNYFEGYDDMNC